MSGDLGSAHFQRGQHLLRVRRFRDAEAAFQDALKGDPQSDVVLHSLALSIWNQGNREKEALAVIEQAVGASPNDPDHHALKALIIATVHNAAKAMDSADQAIRLDPASVFAWFVRSKLYLDIRSLAKAESDARTALRLDPNHSGAANVLSHALRMQGKVAENAGQIAGMLARDPQNHGNHAAAGWNAIQTGKYEQAQTHFREALRLDPDSEFARQGLIESFKARSRLYRLYIRWALWMSSKSEKFQWGVILGLVVAMQFSKVLFTGPFAPLAALLAVFYAIFVLWVHIARGLGNFMLVCDRIARHALRYAEKWEASVVGGCVITSVLLGAAGAVMWAAERDSELAIVLLLFAGCLLAAAIPFSHTFTNPSRLGRAIFGTLGSYALVAGFAVLLSPWLLAWFSAHTIVGMARGALLACLLCTWLANVPALRRA